MARAMLSPVGEKGGRGKKASQNEEFSVSPGYISMARFVLRHDDALARSVMSGAETLNTAYETAKASATARSVMISFTLAAVKISPAWTRSAISA